ncbi:MAG: hypothetical protein C0478_11655 [Planctomyces sp.]|nr:hypothetical protein [Planctomyces sp.]
MTEMTATPASIQSISGETEKTDAKSVSPSADRYDDPDFFLRVEVLCLAILLSAFGLGFLVFRSRPNPDSLAVVALFFAIPYLISLAGVLISSKRPARYMVLPTLLLSLIGVLGTVYALDIQRTDAQGGMMFLLIWYVQIVLSPISLVMAALRGK